MFLHKYHVVLPLIVAITKLMWIVILLLIDDCGNWKLRIGGLTFGKTDVPSPISF